MLVNGLPQMLPDYAGVVPVIPYEMQNLYGFQAGVKIIRSVFMCDADIDCHKIGIEGELSNSGTHCCMNGQIGGCLNNQSCQICANGKGCCLPLF